MRALSVMNSIQRLCALSASIVAIIVSAAGESSPRPQSDNAITNTGPTPTYGAPTPTVGGGGAEKDDAGLAIEISGPEKADKGQIIGYRIVATWTAPLGDVIVTDHYTKCVTYFASSELPASIDHAARTIKWHASNTIPAGANGLAHSRFEIVLRFRITCTNDNLVNCAEADSRR